MRRTAGTILAALMLLGCTNAAKEDPRAEKMLEGMSVREKVAQIIVMHTFSDDSLNRTRFGGYIDSLHIGGLILQDRPDGLKHSIEWLNEIQSRSHLPVLVTIDAEWGLAMRFKDEYPELPRFTDIAAMDNPSRVARSIGRCIGKDMQDLGIHVNFSPVVDLNTNESSVKSRRSFGNDWKEVSKLSWEMLRGMHEGGARGCAKHFPGIGASQMDSHYQMVYTPLSKEELEATHLKPFRNLIRKDVEMIMIAHVCAASLDSLNIPSSISRKVITDYLKGELGFRGIVITDALQMHGVTDYAGDRNPSLLAYEAGADLLLMPEDPYAAVDAIASAVESGALPEEELDEKVLKMLRLKLSLGLFDRPVTIDDIEGKIAASIARNIELNRTLGYEVK